MCSFFHPSLRSYAEPVSNHERIDNISRGVRMILGSSGFGGAHAPQAPRVIDSRRIERSIRVGPAARAMSFWPIATHSRSAGLEGSMFPIHR